MLLLLQLFILNLPFQLDCSYMSCFCEMYINKLIIYLMHWYIDPLKKINNKSMTAKL